MNEIQRTERGGLLEEESVQSSPCFNGHESCFCRKVISTAQKSFTNKYMHFLRPTARTKSVMIKRI